MLGESHRILKNSLHELIDKEIAPQSIIDDKLGKYPTENMKRLSDFGIFGLVVPEKYGGGGMDPLAYAIAMEEIARGCAACATLVTAHLSLYQYPILQFGTEDQIQKFVVPYQDSKNMGSFCLSEPENGSDSGAAKTKALQKDGSWIINGTKSWITGGNLPGACLVMATVDPSKKHNGIGCFIVPKPSDGLEIGKLEDKLGIRASPTVQMHFNDVKIPLENCLGKPGEGFKIAMRTLDTGRIGIAGLGVGIAQAALDIAVKYAHERKAFGQSIAKFQAIQVKLAEMESKITAARLTMWHAAGLKMNGEDISKMAAIAKLLGSQAATFCSFEAVQILGGMGFVKDLPAERYFRDSRVTEIYEGTTEIQKLVICGKLLREYGF